MEENTLDSRMWSLLDVDDDGWVSLEDVLVCFSRAASGDTLRPNITAPAPLRPPCVWENEHDALSRQAAFAFQLYDLNNNGRLSAEEVCTLVTEVIGGNARAVDSTLRAIGAVRAGYVDLQSFQLMALHASNFLYPAFRLQQKLSQLGQGATETIRVLRGFFDAPLAEQGRNRQAHAGRVKHPPFDFGHEEGDPAVPARGRGHAHAHAAHPAADWGEPDPLQPDSNTQPRRRASPPRPPHASGMEQNCAQPLSPTPEVVAAAFRAVRLGRCAEVEQLIASGELRIDIAFEPHAATLLHVAAAHGHRSLCRRLLVLGAAPRARDALGRTAAEVALAYRHWDVAAALKAAGVPVSAEVEVHALRERAQWSAQQRALTPPRGAQRDDGDDGAAEWDVGEPPAQREWHQVTGNVLFDEGSDAAEEPWAQGQPGGYRRGARAAAPRRRSPPLGR